MLRPRQLAGAWPALLGVILLAGTCRIPACAIGLGDAMNAAKSVPKNEKTADSQKTDTKATEDLDVKLPPWTGPKKRLGIMDMEVKITTTQAVQPTPQGGYNSTTTTTVSIPPPADFGSGLSEMLTTALIDTGRFVLLERKALMDIQAEQALAASGSVDPAGAAGSGKLLGAQALIRGAVTEYSYRSSSTGGSASFLQGVSVAATNSEALVGLNVRIYDVATGTILDSVRAEGKAKASAAAVDITKADYKVGGNTFNQSPLGAATRQAINRAVVAICKRMDLIPWEGRIAEIDEGTPPTLYLNAGTQCGMKEGMKLEIVRMGRPIKDPETATIIGRTKDTYLGKCKITQCMEKMSLAEPIEGQGFQVGDAIHLLDWKGPVNRDTTPPAQAPTTPTTGQESTAAPAPNGTTTAPTNTQP